MENITLLVGLTSACITTIWSYKIAKKRNASNDMRIWSGIIGFLFSWLGLIFVICFVGKTFKIKKSRAYVVIPACFVTWMVMTNPPYTSNYLTGISAIFIITSIWILSLGLIFDAE